MSAKPLRIKKQTTKKSSKGASGTASKKATRRDSETRFSVTIKRPGRYAFQIKRDSRTGKWTVVPAKGSGLKSVGAKKGQATKGSLSRPSPDLDVLMPRPKPKPLK